MFGDVQQNFVQQNIRQLLDSQLPAQISRFEESSISLERVAAFCEANYLQSTNKADSLAETKRYALQSLASFAFLVDELSRSLLSALELESLNLSDKTSQIRNIAQLVAIQKEKAARREIGKLTANKNVIRLNKITYPSSEERTPRYQRTPIDFSVLDGIGHGRRIIPPVNEYGTIGAAHRQGTYGHVTLNRTGSMLSSGRAATGGVQQNQQPIYEHYARANYGTLSRGSSLLAPPSVAVSSLHDQYRVPLPIPSSVVPPAQQPFVRSVHYQHFHAAQYASPPHHLHPSVGRGSEVSENAMGGGAASNDRHQQNHHGSANNDQCTAGQSQQQQQWQHYEPMGQIMQIIETAHNPHLDNNEIHLQQQPQPIRNNSAGGRMMNNSADFSDDGLPLPPPLLLSNTVGPTDHHGGLNQRDDGFPPPPTLQHPPGLDSAVGDEPPNWIPTSYIEKAVVLYDYDAQNSDELHLYQGAVVYVMRKNEDGWFEGVMNGITGLFPSNYVQSIQ